MKKLSAFFVMLMLMLAAGVCAHAADFNVENTALPNGEAYKQYTAQINMIGGNTGYSFEFESGFKPAGITINQDGSVTGMPTTAGSFKIMRIRISHTDGTSALVNFTIKIYPKKVKLAVQAPENAVYDGITQYTASGQYYDMDGNQITENTPVLVYGKDRLSSAVDAGTYYIDYQSPSAYSITAYEGDRYLTVSPAAVTGISVQDRTYSYDGAAHGLTTADITVTPSQAGYAVEYRKQGTSEFTSDLPVSSGVYTARVYTTNPNYEPTSAEATVTIQGSTVNFMVSDTTAVYDGAPHSVTVSADKDVEYTVEYIDSNGITVSGSPINAGTYKIKIILTNTDAYLLGTVSADTITISPKPVNFTLAADLEYTGSEQTPTVISNPDINGKYTITYKQPGQGELSTVTDAGTYDVVISISDGNYSISDSSLKTVTVAPKTVSFTVTNNDVQYDGNAHTASVAPDTSLDSSEYTVKYKDKNGSLHDSVRDAGVYDIVITFVSGNYALSESFSESMTITSLIVMNLGNSPAAMIYLDSSHTNDTAWQEAALGELMSNYKFSDHVPAQCSSAITYHPINTLTPDCNKNTVIVRSIDEFTDPGLSVNGTVIKGSVPSAVAGVDGLYKVTYSAEGQTFERYVMTVSRIGDTNADGNVNAIDANMIDGMNADTDGVVQARVWDVNKDGRIDANDAAAIRLRFKNKLVAYYPWVIN